MIFPFIIGNVYYWSVFLLFVPRGTPSFMLKHSVLFYLFLKVC